MKLYIAVDDTDSIDKGSTGESAAGIISCIETKGWGQCQGITRHQLLLHSDIPYTSHNSAMCFIADVQEECLEQLISEASRFLCETSVPGSDPGLCVAAEQKIQDTENLMDFGRKAKKKLVTKEAAYSLARELGVHLSEHGGTGVGIIGALAGVGLRMTENDGRFQGKIILENGKDTFSVGQIKHLAPVAVVQTRAGELLGDEETVHISHFIKRVLLNGNPTLLVKPDVDAKGWRNCSREQLKVY